MEKIEFKDRVAQYPHRFRITRTGEDGVYTITPEPGVVTEPGEVTAEMLNNMQDNIETAIGQGGVAIDPTLSIEGEAADAKAVGDALAAKADQKGTYTDMTVGTAKQLLSTVYTTDKEPYLFRAAGGSVDIGNRERDALVGGTVVWNQLINEDTSQYQYTKNTINLQYNVPLKLGHKYYVHEENRLVAGASSYTYTSVGFWNSDITKYVRVDTLSRRNNNEFSGVITFTTLPSGTTEDDFTKFVFQYISSGSAVDNAAQYRRLQLIDLTQMFGSTIADYIYSLEGSNRGSGVAWFKKLFPKDYYPHNPGELMSVSASAHKTVGFNAWDEEWEVGSISAVTGENTSANNCIRSTNYIRLIPGKEYYFKGSFGNGVMWYDANKQFAGATLNALNNVLTVPDGVHYCRFVLGSGYGTTYNHDVCINLSWDGYRDGEYAPYEAHTYPLDSDVVLRGIPKLDVSNNLYYDGDTYASDGTVTRKYGTRAYQIGDENDPTLITDGTNTVYPRANIVTEAAAAFGDLQVVDSHGTEEYVDERAVPVPVGHATNYPQDLLAKLERLPEGGATPDITATATVDAGAGTPSVTVTKSGTDAAPSFAFTFSNLKGDTGATGATGPQGIPGQNGRDYILTAQDKADIADLVLADLPTWTGGSY